MLLNANAYLFSFPDRSPMYYINPRPAGGGGCLNTPLAVFRGQGKKRRREAPPFFVYLISHQFRTFSENFVPGSSQVRSPGQAK